MLNEPDVIIGMADTATNELIGFAHVLTDTVYKTLIFDVIVRSDHRGTGLEERLIEEVVEHPALSQVAHFELYCLEELVPFYERWASQTCQVTYDSCGVGEQSSPSGVDSLRMHIQ